MSSGSGPQSTGSLPVRSPRPHHRVSPYPSNPPVPSRSIPDSVLGRPPTPVTTSSPLEAKLAELRSAIQGVKDSLSGLPPVQTVVSRLEDCLAYLPINGEQNCYECGMLVSGLSDLIPLLWKPFVESNPQNVPQVIIETVKFIEARMQEIQVSPDYPRAAPSAQGVNKEKLILKRFRDIGEGFRNLRVQIVDWEEKREQWTDTRLERLLPALEACYNAALPATVTKRVPCTEHTRVDLLDGAWEWSLDNNEAKIYWLNGMAGTGKTTIAYTVCKMLQDDKRLGGSFFCSRNSPHCRDVNKIIPTIAYQLARYSYIYLHRLCDVFEDDPDIATRDIGTQFENLISKPLAISDAKMPNNVVVVIDALDECVDIYGTRDVLDLLLQHAGNLPIKFFVASRPEPEISDRMMRSDGAMRSILWLHDIDKSVVQADIRTYLVKALQPIQVTPSEFDGLVERAGCLFIFAATAVRYIAPDSSSVNHKQRLLTVLKIRQVRGNKSYKDIDELYTTILLNAFDENIFEEEELAQRRSVLWSVVCMIEALEISALVELLGIPDIQSVEQAIRPLQSVLHVSETSNVVSPLHASFPDFLLDKDRARKFHCDEVMQSATLAKCCFQLMGRSLRFNICGLETSYILDRDVPNLKDRVDSVISIGLFYSCRYWGNHLTKCLPSPPLVSLLDSFMRHHLLFWMEVLNLKGQISHGDGALGQASTWLLTESDITDLQEFMHDARTFLVIFASHPTSLSTPHLYISALPFASKENLVKLTYWPRTQGLVRIESKSMGGSGNLVLATWAVGNEVHSIAKSSDGKHIASGSGAWGGDGEVNVWDLASGTRILGPLEGHEKWVCAVAFSPDGTRIASGSVDKTIRLWDANHGYVIAGPLRGHTNAINSLSFSSDGSCLASGSHDHTIRLWGVPSGAPLGEPLKGHQGCVLSVAFSPNLNNNQLASGSNDCSIRLWDLQTQPNPVVQAILEGHSAPVWSIAYSSDALRLVSGSSDRTIRVWNVSSGTLLADPFMGHADHVTSVSFSPDGGRIVSGSRDRSICLWEAGSGTLLARSLEAHNRKITSVLFTADGTRILSGSQDSTIRVWDPRHAAIMILGQSDSINTMAWSPDGTRVASGSHDGVICLWDTRDGALVGGPFKAHTSQVHSIAFFPDNARVISASGGGTFFPGSARIIWASNEGNLCPWDAFTCGSLVSTLQGTHSRFNSVAFSPDGSQVASGSSNGPEIWNSYGGELIFASKGLIDYEFPVKADVITYSPDGARLVLVYEVSNLSRLSGTSHGKKRRGGNPETVIQMWDINDRISRPWTSELREHGLACVAFSPDGTQLACGFYLTIRVLDASTGKHSSVRFQGYDDCHVTSIAFSPNGARIVSGNQDRRVRVWDAQSGEMVAGPLEGHTGQVISVTFSPDGSRILSGSSDGMVRSWDLEAVTEPDAMYDHNLCIGNDGWLTDSNSQLLLWVPADLRAHFRLPTLANPSIITESHSSSIGDSMLHMGNQWHNCYRSPSSPTV